MTLHAALDEIVGLTEAALEQCRCGDASPQSLLELAARRSALLDDVTDPPATNDALRTIVARLQQLDAEILRWCVAAQHELELSRSRIPSRDPAPRVAAPDAARVLSDIA